MVQPVVHPVRVSLAVAHLSDAGLDPDKQVNEDACASKDLGIGHLLVVCDGMGGHMGGREASEAAIKTIFDDVQGAAVGANPGAVLKAAIEHAGHVVYDLGGSPSNVLRPGSTVVAVLAHAGGSEVAHVGDSRVYLIRANEIHPLTRDHSMVQQMVDAGVLKPEEAIGHPEANKITRALGMSATVDVELRPTPLGHQPGDIFLLASDGLSDLLSPQEMLGITTQAKQGGLEFACQQLVSMANSRGGHDNITVLLAEILSCPTCPESQYRTVVGTDEEPSPATVPVPTMLGTNGPIRGGVHPTLVDDGYGSSEGVHESRGSPPTWVEDDPEARESDLELADLIRRRRVTWLLVGVALVIIGVVLVITSIWWALDGSAVLREVDGARDKCLVAAVEPWEVQQRVESSKGELLKQSRVVAPFHGDFGDRKRFIS